MSMRAVVMQDGNLRVDNIDIPSPQKGEVLVKTRACGICGSDLHAVAHTHDFIQTSREAGGAFKLTTDNPVVLGHEFCAEIVDYGPATQKSMKPGQLVCSVPALNRKSGGAIGYSDTTPGGFAQYMVLSEPFLLAVPDGIKAASAALTEPLAVGLHAVNKANLSGRECAVVIGCGPVGLAVITALKALGHGPIIAADFSAARRQHAINQGADIVVDAAAEHPLNAELIRANKGKHEQVVVFECVGIPGMLDDIFLHAQQNTKIIVVGVCLQQDSIRPLIAINKELSIQFVLGYSLQEFEQSLYNICEGKFAIDDLITHQIGLDQVAQTFEDLRTPNSHAKVIVEPWD